MSAQDAVFSFMDPVFPASEGLIDLKKIHSGESPSNPTESIFKNFSNVSPLNPEEYARAQFMLAHLICFKSNLTPKQFLKESESNKVKRIQAMMPYMREAAAKGLVVAGFCLARLEMQLMDLQTEEA